MLQNARTRRGIPNDFGLVSLDILNRTTIIPMDPDHREEDLEALAHNIKLAAVEIDGGSLGPGQAYRALNSPNLQKFDAHSGS